MIQLYSLVFQPVFKERVWGGQRKTGAFLLLFKPLDAQDDLPLQVHR